MTPVIWIEDKEIGELFNDNKKIFFILPYNNVGWLELAADTAKRKGNIKKFMVYKDLEHLLGVLDIKE